MDIELFPPVSENATYVNTNERMRVVTESGNAVSTTLLNPGFHGRMARMGEGERRTAGNGDVGEGCVYGDENEGLDEV